MPLAPDYGQVLSHQVLYNVPGKMGGWPTIMRSRSGELAVVFSGDRQQHVDPYGKTVLMRSGDEGESWTEPQVINDTPLDDRDPGIIETAAGTWLVSFFTSRTFADWQEQALRHYGAGVVDPWQPYIDRLTPEISQEYLGSFVRRSTDGGRSWGPLIRVPLMTSHGPVTGRDGRLLYLGYSDEGGIPTIAFCESTDDGLTWQKVSTICRNDIFSNVRFHEPHVVELPDGRLFGMIRSNAAKEEDRILYQTESVDGGRTWSQPQNTGVWGLPPHLLLHSSGVLICAYGHRRLPFGQRAILSYDQGKSWTRELILNEVDFAAWQKARDVGRAEKASHDYFYQDPDLGYPATAELADGSLYTVYYQSYPDRPGAGVYGVRWALPE